MGQCQYKQLKNFKNVLFRNLVTYFTFFDSCLCWLVKNRRNLHGKFHEIEKGNIFISMRKFTTIFKKNVFEFVIAASSCTPLCFKVFLLLYNFYNCFYASRVLGADLCVSTDFPCTYLNPYDILSRTLRCICKTLCY